MADWKKIKTEYITTDTSYRKLSQKYGVRYATVQERGQKEDWPGLRDQHRTKTVSKSIEKISGKQSDNIARISDLADQLMVKLEQAIGELDMQVVTKRIKVETENREETTVYKEAMEGGVVDRAGLRQLTAALKDLKEVKGVMSDLDRQEQEARIANLKKQAQKDDRDTAITVTLERELTEYAE